MEPFIMGIIIDSKQGLKNPGTTSVNFETCRGCNKRFTRLINHLVKVEQCKRKYSEEEIRNTAKLRKSQRNKTYQNKHKREKAEYNVVYNQLHKKELTEYHAAYHKTNKEEIAKRKAKYNKRNRDKLTANKKRYREKINLGWYDCALQDLLQDRPRYRKLLFPSGYIELWIDTNQLFDCLVYFKEQEELPEYQDVDLDYSLMPTSCQLQPQPTKPHYPEVGLNHTVLHPREKTSDPEVKFNGKEIKLTHRIVMKLRTMPSQPHVEKGVVEKLLNLDNESGEYWVIDPYQLIDVVRHWKKKGHLSLKGIRFPDIPEVGTI